jgi:hypothetical protein
MSAGAERRTTKKIMQRLCEREIGTESSCKSQPAWVSRRKGTSVLAS